MRAQWRPEEVNPTILPWLAWGMSADLWSDEWTDAQRAEAVRRSIELHRLKGTRGGAVRYVALVGGNLTHTIAFGRAAYASPAVSKEARDAWLGRMPQIRVYYGDQHGTRGANAFTRRSFAGHAFARFDAGAALYGRLATYRTPDGVETPIRRSTLVETVETRNAVLDRVHVPGLAGRAAFIGGFCGKAAMGSVERASNVFTYSLDRSYSVTTSELHLETLAPSLDPIDVKYARVSEVGEAGRAAFDGRFVGACFAAPSRAERQLYDRVYLHDKDVDAPWVKAHSFCGTARIGLPAYHAHHMVDIKRPARRRAGFIGHARIGSGFATPNNPEVVSDVVRALRLSKAARDRVFVTTKTRRSRRFGDGIPLDGSFRFGTTVAQEL